MNPILNLQNIFNFICKLINYNMTDKLHIFKIKLKYNFNFIYLVNLIEFVNLIKFNHSIIKDTTITAYFYENVQKKVNIFNIFF